MPATQQAASIRNVPCGGRISNACSRPRVAPAIAAAHRELPVIRVGSGFARAVEKLRLSARSFASAVTSLPLVSPRPAHDNLLHSRVRRLGWMRSGRAHSSKSQANRNAEVTCSHQARSSQSWKPKNSRFSLECLGTRTRPRPRLELPAAARWAGLASSSKTANTSRSLSGRTPGPREQKPIWTGAFYVALSEQPTVCFELHPALRLSELRLIG